MRGRKLQYLVRWKGYRHKENLWILEGDLDAPDLIADFYRTHPNALKMDQCPHLWTYRFPAKLPNLTGMGFCTSGRCALKPG
jgi:hypothetical protein